jgi:putative inorganic carbon (HCO3(-)) transporter
MDALELGWLVAAIALPLTINPWGSNAFELPKAALLKALVLIMGLIVLVRIAEGRTSVRRSQDLPLLFSTLALGLTFALATAFSTNSRASLWGDYARQQGLLTLCAYLALFWMTATFLNTRAQAERLWLALVWGSVPVLIYALVQLVRLDPIDWRSDAASPIVSTLGRSNFVGTYLVLILPLTLARLGVSSFKPAYMLLLAAQWLCLAFTQARGAWIGAGSAMITIAICWVIAARNKRMAYALIALLVLLGLFAAWLTQVPGTDRLASLTRTDEGSTAARLTIWQTTLSLIAARPILGYGPDTMALAFPRVFPPQLVYYQGRLLTVDRAHNLWLDTAMSAGLVGVVCFVTLLFATGYRFLKVRQSISETWERWLGIALAGSVAGHLIDLEFGFDVIATASIFWLIFALTVALGHGWSVPVSGVTHPRRWTRLLPYAPAAALIALILGAISARPMLADIASQESQSRGRALATRIGAGERAVQLWALEPEYHLRLAWLYFEAGNPGNADAEVNAADQLNPDNPHIWATRGDLFARAARYAQAQDAYRHASDLAPNITTYHAALGWALAQQSRQEEAVHELRRAVDLDATDADVYRELAQVYTALGRDADATWARQEAVRWSK